MSTGRPLMLFGRRWFLLICFSGNFARTRNFTAIVPVLDPSEIFSPMPTPTRFHSGLGVMAVVRFRNAGTDGRLSKRLAHSRLAARMSFRFLMDEPNITAVAAWWVLGFFGIGLSS